MPSGTCARCGGHRKWLHRHHVKPRCEGGTDADGIEMLCANCHEDVHEGPMGGKSMEHRRRSPEANAKRSASMRAAWARGSHANRKPRSAEAEERRLAATRVARSAAKGTEAERIRGERSAKARRAKAAERSRKRNRLIALMREAGFTGREIGSQVRCSVQTVHYTLRLVEQGKITID